MPGVYLTTIQSNPIFQNLEKHIFSFYCLFVCGAFPRTCAFVQVWRDLGRSQKWSTITAFVSPNYMEKPQICICLLCSPPTLAHVHTLAHMSWPQNKTEPRIGTSRLGEKLKRKTVDVPLLATIFFFNSNYMLWDNKGICLLWGWIYHHVLVRPDLHFRTSLSV